MEAYARGGEEQAGNKKKLGLEGSMHEKKKEKTACDSYFLSIGALVSRKLDLVPPVQKAIKVLFIFCSFPAFPPSSIPVSVSLCCLLVPARARSSEFY